MQTSGETTVDTGIPTLNQIIARECPDLWLQIHGPTPMPDHALWLTDDGNAVSIICEAVSRAREEHADEPYATEALAHGLMAPLYKELAELLTLNPLPSTRIYGHVLHPETYDAITNIGAQQTAIEVEDIHVNLIQAFTANDRNAIRFQIEEAREQRERLERLCTDVEPILPKDWTLRSQLDQAEAARTRAIGRTFLEATAPTRSQRDTAIRLINEKDETLMRRAQGALAAMTQSDQARAIAHAASEAAIKAGISEQPDRTMAELEASAILTKALLW